MSKRSEIRNKRANDVCRELRHQLSANYNWEPEVLVKHLLKWMAVANKDKYTRP